jgi:polyisoprenyl-phosphate glycosyltransferase
MDVSVVIPVFNSQNIIPELCKQLKDALSSYQFEVILINDASSDSSWSEIEQVCENHVEFRGVCLTRNFGQDNAIMAGLSFTQAESVVIMDDDLQHSPYEIESLLEQSTNGYDVCYADYHATMNQSFWKNIGSLLNSKQAEYLIEKPRNIYLSPFKVISRTVVDAILNYKGPYPYIDGLIFQITSSITQISVPFRKRMEGSSNYNISKSLKVFFKHTTGFSIVPLRLTTLVGFIMGIMGFFLIIYFVFIYFLSDDIVEGWTTLTTLILFIGGVIMMALGIIGEYLGRVYLSINCKPQFLVKKITDKK